MYHYDDGTVTYIAKKISNLTTKSFSQVVWYLPLFEVFPRTVITGNYRPVFTRVGKTCQPWPVKPSIRYAMAFKNSIKNNFKLQFINNHVLCKTYLKYQIL